MTTSPHVVVVGGGYAGIMAARAARDRRCRVTVVDADGHHDFLPRLATVAAGVGPPTDAMAPIADLLADVDVVSARAVAVDHGTRKVLLDGGDPLGYDALVVAAGSHARAPDIPRLADHAWTLRTARDALRLRDRVMAAESLVVVGAGSTGTQLAGEVAAARPSTRVVLVEMAGRILPSLPRSLSRRAADVLAGRGVRIRTGLGLVEVAPHGATFDDDSSEHGLVVWAGGFASDGGALLPDAPTVDGRVVVDRCAQLAGHGPLFVAGDIAAHRARSGRMLPQTAQVAVQAGNLAGTNAARVAQGTRPRPSTLHHIGWVLPLGGGQAVAQVGPIVLADPLGSRLAPLLHDAIDVRHLLRVGGLPAAVDHHQRR